MGAKVQEEAMEPAFLGSKLKKRVSFQARICCKLLNLRQLKDLPVLSFDRVAARKTLTMQRQIRPAPVVKPPEPPKALPSPP